MLSPKIIFAFLSCVIFTNQLIVSGAKLKCDYNTSGGWNGFDETVYYCTVKDNGIFADPRVILDSVEGTHSTGKTNSNVQGAFFDGISSLKYFPQNLEGIFSNLIFIKVASANFQEIKQSDLKFFTKLKCFRIQSTKITTIDQDLFKFNPELKSILLYSNQITHIDPNVFDHLDNLSTLWLDGNKCKNSLSRIEKSRSAVLKLVERLRDGECVSSEILQKKKEAEEQAIKVKNDECATEKSTLSIQIHELEEKLRDAEKITQEKVKTSEELIAEFRKNNNDLREQNQKLQDESKEFKTLKGKYEEVLQSKLTMSETHSEKLQECNNKYTTLLHTKLTESEKVNKELNEEIRNINKVSSTDGNCMTIFSGNNQPPTIVVN